MPTWAGASSRRTALDDSNRFCAVWEARRTINAQAIALFRTYEVATSPSIARRTPQSLFGNHFPARARDYVDVRRATRQPLPLPLSPPKWLPSVPRSRITQAVRLRSAKLLPLAPFPCSGRVAPVGFPSQMTPLVSGRHTHPCSEVMLNSSHPQSSSTSRLHRCGEIRRGRLSVPIPILV